MLLVLGGLLLWSLPARGASPIVIKPVSPTSVQAGTTLTIAISVFNTDIAPPNQVVFQPFPLAGWPAGASLLAIDITNTLFSWTPTPAQVGTTNLTVSAFDLLSFGLNSNTMTFTVTVTPTITPVGGVVIDPILPQTVMEGATLTFTNRARATDNPTNALVFSLINAPSGATLTNNTPTSGVFTWTPTAAQAATPSYTIHELVTEPSASASSNQDFQVTVTRTNNCAQLDAFLAAVQQGGYFPLSNCTTIVLTNTLTISNSVTLDAGMNNVTISGNNLFRLFTVLPGVTNFTLRGLTLSGGQDPSGGGLYVSQGAAVVLTNCTFVGNRAAGGDGPAGAAGSSGGNNGGNGGNGTGGGSTFGGAIHNLGDLTVQNCRFLTNSAVGGNGGAGGGGGNGSGIGRAGNGGDGGYGAPAQGGAIYSAGVLWLSNCTFFGNSATGGNGGVGGTNGTGTGGVPGTGGAGTEGSGSAVYSANYAVIVNCTFSSNIGHGGDSAPGGTDSAGNGISGQPGGGSLGGGVCNLNTGFLTNCTFSGDRVTGGNGGNGGNAKSIRKGGNGGNGGNGLGGSLYNAGNIVVVNCTFSGGGAQGGTNGLAGSGLTSGTDGSMGLGVGGDIAEGSGSFILQNSILATNSTGGNAYDTGASPITDGGYNLSSDGSLSLAGTSLNNTDPQLSSTLANNGGPTLTLAFLTNTSPAIDKIPPSAGPATDQRGIPRPQPQGGLSDMGAYELVTLPAIQTQPQSQTIAQGGNATFAVVAFGDSLNYQWRFNATNLIPNAVTASFTISNVAGANAGNYDVVIGNSSGSVTSAVAGLTVLLPLAITMQPSNQTAVVGGNVTLNVAASGTPPLNYQWRLNGTNISGAVLPAYALGSVQATDAGAYDVIIANNYGSVTSLTAVLTVFPSFPLLTLSRAPNGSPKLAFTAAFTCGIEASTNLKSWQSVFATNNIATNTLILQFTDTNAAAFPKRFYRLAETFAGRPVLTNLASTNRSLSFDCVAAQILDCQIEASTDLKNWTGISTNSLPTNSVPFQFRYSDTNNSPVRFYRLYQTPGF